MEEFTSIISFFAGALVAKNWPQIRNFFSFSEQTGELSNKDKKTRAGKVRAGRRKKIIKTGPVRPRQKSKSESIGKKQSLTGRLKRAILDLEGKVSAQEELAPPNPETITLSSPQINTPVVPEKDSLVDKNNKSESGFWSQLKDKIENKK